MVPDLADGVGQMAFERINNMIFGYTPIQVALIIMGTALFLIIVNEVYRLFKRLKDKYNGL